MIIEIIVDYYDNCRLLQLLQILQILREFRKFLIKKKFKHTRFDVEHHSSVLQVIWHTTLCYLGMPMDCHVIFQLINSRSFVQRRILYVGFLDLNRGFQRFCDASDDIGRHEGSGTHPCNNCT